MAYGADALDVGYLLEYITVNKVLRLAITN